MIEICLWIICWQSSYIYGNTAVDSLLPPVLARGNIEPFLFLGIPESSILGNMFTTTVHSRRSYRPDSPVLQWFHQLLALVETCKQLHLIWITSVGAMIWRVGNRNSSFLEISSMQMECIMGQCRLSAYDTRQRSNGEVVVLFGAVQEDCCCKKISK